MTQVQHVALSWLCKGHGVRSGADREMTRYLISLRRAGFADSEPTQPVTWFLTDKGEAARSANLAEAF